MPVTAIGRITESPGLVPRHHGEIVQVSGPGYRHFT